MRRRMKLQLRAGKALYDEACRKAGIAFSERRFDDAIRIYEQFAQEHPQVLPEQLQMRLTALREYVTEHLEKLPTSAAS